MAAAAYIIPTGPAPLQGESAGRGIGSELLPFEAWSYIRKAMRLSERELTIVQQIFADVDPKNTAAELGMSAEALYMVLQKIYVKLRIGSRAELVVRVMSENLAFVADQPEAEFSGYSYWVPRTRKPVSSQSAA